ncbi:MAG: SDR family oxidoreductase [Acidobacteriota bacterium]
MRILIAGCGYVGTALAELLCTAGHEVWALRRTSQASSGRVCWLRADLTQSHSLTALPGHLDYVFYLAAADNPSDEAYEAIYVRGLKNLIDALVAQRQPLRRLFFTSSTAVYGQSEGAWVDESSPADSRHFTGQRILQAESVLRVGPFAHTAVRLGGIYGPGRDRLLRWVRSGSAVCAEGPAVYTNRIHRDDCAGVLAHLMLLDQPESLYLGVDKEPVEKCVVLTWLCDQLGMPRPLTVEISTEPSDRTASNKRCSNRRLLSTGYRFRYPTFREGYAAMLSEEQGSPP